MLTCSKESSNDFCIYLSVEVAIIKDLRVEMIGWMQKWCSGHSYLTGVVCYRGSLWDKVDHDVTWDAIREKDSQSPRGKATKLQAITSYIQQNNICFEVAHEFPRRDVDVEMPSSFLQETDIPIGLLHGAVPSSCHPSFSSAGPAAQQVLCQSLHGQQLGGEE